MLSSVSSANSSNVIALNTASLLAQVREARKASFVDAPANAEEPTYVKQLYNAYVQFFLGDTDAKKVGLEEIENVLKDQLNAVLSLVSSKKTYDFPLDIAKILDENKLTNACKKGNEAYKFYVRKIVSELNNLHEIITSAKNNLSRLQTLIRTEDFENPAIRELLTQLRLAEIDGEAIKKTFSEYMVPKNFEITYFDIYWYNGKPAQIKTASTAKSAAQGSEAYTMPEATEIDWDKEKKEKKTTELTFPSSIPDDISSVDDLRTKIKTEKLTGSRVVYTYFFKKGSVTEMTDRYDTSADVYYVTKDTIEEEKTKNDEISFFGELPLLDKLKYIILYYTKSGTRRTFPENDAVNGFPCLSNPPPTGVNPATRQDRKYTDDVNEIARLEPFYIGFLVDRDGPVNALASFMEIKSVAINEQIKVLGYRIKALRHYLHLINRGLEEVNKSQSNGNARIPNSAYEILTMVGSNPTRCLKTIDGKDYFVLQWNGNEGKASYHTAKNNHYLLVPANDEGIEAFIKYGNQCDYCYDRLFDENAKTCDNKETLRSLGLISDGEISEHEKQEQYLKNISIHCEKNTEIATSLFSLRMFGKWSWYYNDSGKEKFIAYGSNFKTFPDDCPLLLLNEPDESKLPRELETNRMNITRILNQDYSGTTWNNYKGDKTAESVWSLIVSNWKTTCDTVIGNVQTQLESVNKSIESLRNKINTFDESAINFRNKAYTIYNKTVNNIE